MKIIFEDVGWNE